MCFEVTVACCYLCYIFCKEEVCPCTRIKQPTQASTEDKQEDKLKMTVEGLISCAKYGFPLNTLDLRLSAKAYLDRIEKKSRFKNNLSGYDWAKGVLKRHIPYKLQVNV
ncbi:hypothetical protein ILUMI_19750 [Ignelater luminosus]|uniref:Uncharacterized protein n=1 Tax=Ignelater luminosus TaxID=2038154 RepID=A0A8K0G5J6_IGNLU|nr:hypothetical protein ILUMI_19750 [Ignelater luminosus]